jgi:hypothetical protein
VKEFSDRPTARLWVREEWLAGRLNVEQRLKQAIDDTFLSDRVRTFLGELQVRNGRIRYIEEASSDLSSSFAGGAYGRGQVLDVNFIDPYQKLDEQSRQRVKTYYEARVEAVQSNLKKEFEKVFRR